VQIRDDGVRYGLVTRTLHWAVAALLAWQFTGMAIKLILGRVPLSAFFVGTHQPLGGVLFTLIAVRALWGLYNLRRRPPHAPGLIGRAALAGHGLLYALMLTIPSLGLLRAAGSGKGYAPFGVEIFPRTGRQVDWMVAPAERFHGELAWTLCAAIAGHIVMVLAHRFVWRDETLAKMVGRPAAVEAG
jgi:cytochrome b561